MESRRSEPSEPSLDWRPVTCAVHGYALDHMSPHSQPPMRGASVAPAPVPPLQPGLPPLAILVDYDGTIAQTDVTDEILRKFTGERYAADDAAYNAGLVGSRTLFTSQVTMLPGVPDEVLTLAEGEPHHATFAPFVARAQQLGVPVEVVSDGFGFYIEPALARMGVPKIPVITARTVFDGKRARMEFPFGHPDCLVCGTCKRQRVTAHRAAGRTVALVGDGVSDVYAAAIADLIFAKGALVDLCRQNRWAFTRWDDFADLEAWLVRTASAWRADPSSLPRHRSRAVTCGPEVWGIGRTDPPARR